MTDNKQPVRGSDRAYLDSLVQDLANNMDKPSRDVLAEQIRAYDDNGFDVYHYMLNLAQYDTNTDHHMIIKPYLPHIVLIDGLTQLPITQDPGYPGEPTGAVGLKEVYYNDEKKDISGRE